MQPVLREVEGLGMTNRQIHASLCALHLIWDLRVLRVFGKVFYGA
jgi:hypothetical protein